PQPRAVHQTTQPPSAWRAIPPACAANRRGCSSSTMAIARIRRACLASAVRAASARNCEILRSWRVISIADMLPAPRINDMLHRVTFATAWESPRSQVLGRWVLQALADRLSGWLMLVSYRPGGRVVVDIGLDLGRAVPCLRGAAARVT